MSLFLPCYDSAEYKVTIICLMGIKLAPVVAKLDEQHEIQYLRVRANWSAQRCHCSHGRDWHWQGKLSGNHAPQALFIHPFRSAGRYWRPRP